MKWGLLFFPRKAGSLGGSEDSVSLRALQLSRQVEEMVLRVLLPSPSPSQLLTLWLPAAGSVVLASLLPRSSSE